MQRPLLAHAGTITRRSLLKRRGQIQHTKRFEQVFWEASEIKHRNLQVTEAQENLPRYVTLLKSNELRLKSTAPAVPHEKGT